MNLYFASADQSTYLKLLRDNDVKRFAISFYEWRRRFSNDDLSQHFAPDEEVVITAGIAKKTELDWAEFATDYLRFIEGNIERATLIFDIDSVSMPVKVRNDVQAHLESLAQSVMFPYGDLFDFAAKYPRIGINSATAKAANRNDLRKLPAELHGSNITDQRILTEARFATTTTHAWMSPRRYGELWMFSGGRIRRYPAVDMAKAIRDNQRFISEMGLSVDMIKSGDPNVLTQLAVGALLRMEDHLSKRLRDRETTLIADTSAKIIPLNPKDNEPNEPAAPLVPAPVEISQRSKVLLPIFSVESQGDQDVLISEAASLRQCDSCYISDSCPQYKTNASCAFELPVEIKTASDWDKACRVLLEMQFRRVSFGYFAEQMDSGALNNKVGPEMDRFMKLLATLKDLHSAPPVSQPQGVLTRIFADVVAPTDGDEEDTLLDLDDEDDDSLE